MKIDWEMIDSRHISRPNDNTIVKMSEGFFGERICYEHLNWAFKALGVGGYVSTPVCEGPSSKDLACLVRACQKVVKEENLQYIPEPEPKKKPKKSSWFF